MQSVARKMLIDMLDPDEPIRSHKDWDGGIDQSWKVLEFLGYVSPGVEEDNDDNLELEPTPEFDRLIRQCIRASKAKLKGKRLARLMLYLKKRCVVETPLEQSAALPAVLLRHQTYEEGSKRVDVVQWIFRMMFLSFEEIDGGDLDAAGNLYLKDIDACFLDSKEFIWEVFGVLGLAIELPDEDDELVLQPTLEFQKVVKAACVARVATEREECFQGLIRSYEHGFMDKEGCFKEIDHYDEIWNGMLANLNAALNPR